MARITGKFYRNGPDKQKVSDLIVDLKRPDKFRISTWSPEQKKAVLEWICLQEKIFEGFKNEIIDSIKGVKK